MWDSTCSNRLILLTWKRSCWFWLNNVVVLTQKGDLKKGRKPDRKRICAGEDEGYLVTFLTSEGGESRLVVYNAQTMEPRPVASVLMPVRVPSGFHGLHINEEQLAAQL